MPDSADYIIMGNGIAGITAAEAIRRDDAAGSIKIFTDEEYPFYARIRLPQFISGEVSLEKLILKKESWYEEQKIDLHLTEPIIEIDPSNKKIKASNGDEYTYQKLLLAAGSHSFMLPLKGSHQEGIFTLRNITDAIRIKEYIKGKKKAVILGGGLLGLEVGWALMSQGIEIAVIEFFDRLLPRQIDLAGSNILKCMMEAKGYHFHLGLHAEEIIREDGRLKVLMHEGTQVEGDLVLISTGVRPNLDVLREAGVEIDRGVVVNDHLQTNCPDIFAAGDLTEHNSTLYGIWPAAKEQGKIAGANMVGIGTKYTGSTAITALKVAGINMTSIGDIDVDNTKQCVIEIDNASGTYKKFIAEDNAMVGGILLGDTTDKKRLEHAIKEKESIKSLT